MNILVINGSPKGKYSITLHTCLYLEKKFPEHHFGYINAGQRIKSLEKDFSPALEAIDRTEMLLFSYPVYTFIAPSQLHLFIRLMKESGTDFSGKTATQVTTSKHFYDVTAHRWLEDNCADLGMRFLDGLSADMDDLLKEEGRRQAEDWFKLMLWNLEKGYFKEPSARETPSPDNFSTGTIPGNHSQSSSPTGTIPGNHSQDSFSTVTVPGNHSQDRLSTVTVPVEKSGVRKAIIVADIKPQDTRLKAMVESFIAGFPYCCDYMNIEDFPFQGGCISCFSCTATGKCFYKDGFDEYLRSFIHRHDAIIYAFRIEDHSMGARFKIYDDRQFCNGHRTVTMGMPIGYIIEGAYSGEENLRMILEARAQVGGNFLAGVACNESDMDASLQRLSDTLCYALERQYRPPQNFLGVGGMKIFRDLIYLMRGMMRADHKFFKSHGQYDFPQKKWKTSLSMYLIGFLMNNPELKARMGAKINEGMIAPYKEATDKA